MENYKLKIGSSEIKIDENAFNYIKDDALMPKVEMKNANFKDRTIEFEIIYYADPLRTLKFLKRLGTPNYQYHRFFKRKKRITKKRVRNIRTLIKFN